MTEKQFKSCRDLVAWCTVNLSERVASGSSVGAMANEFIQAFPGAAIDKGAVEVYIVSCLSDQSGNKATV